MRISFISVIRSWNGMEKIGWRLGERLEELAIYVLLYPYMRGIFALNIYPWVRLL